MDKRKLVLRFLSLLCVISFLYGCATARGLGEGFASTLKKTAEGTVEDSKNIWQALLKIDKWMRENLW